MAAKAGILSISQKPTDEPREHMKCSTAEAAARRGLLRRIHKHLYQRILLQIPIGKAIAVPCTISTNPRAYEHHIEPKLVRVNRRQEEELERWQEMISWTGEKQQAPGAFSVETCV